MRIPMPARNMLVPALLGTAAMSAALIAVALPNPPAHAQFTVFDPSNFGQNVLTAARTLQQINNQIQSLQNEAQMLINQAKNLSKIDFPELQAITSKLQAIDRLMGQAQGIDFRIGQLKDQFRKLFPDQFDAALKRDVQVQNAEARLSAAMAAFQHTMGVQAQVVENVAADGAALEALAAKSQGAEGGLQAQQATNQLLALVAKQQFQIQNLMAAQFRAETTDAARRTQEGLEARGRTKKFLGTGSAYAQP